mmetsp:Transcript_21911/g.55772  ORF Transcript_21911/g.55772 Transcript_21911/m.55772 type:complete len:276 (-) Transcript_21911:1640-2467(-)
MFAPASTALGAVSAVIPPSTSMFMRGQAALSARTLSIMSLLKDCPPHPGVTVIASTMSTSPSTARGSTASTGVSGESASPARAPAAWMRAASARAPAWRAARSGRPGARPGASMWKVTLDAPASITASTYFSGSSTQRCTSRKARGWHARRDATTGGPTVKLPRASCEPSNTSTWIHRPTGPPGALPPPLAAADAAEAAGSSPGPAPSPSTSATSSPRRAKSAARMEGATTPRMALRPGASSLAGRSPPVSLGSRRLLALLLHRLSRSCSGRSAG